MVQVSDVLEVFHGWNTVRRALSEKAVSRALWGYQLLDLALNAIFLEDLLPELDVDFSVLENLIIDAK